MINKLSAYEFRKYAIVEGIMLEKQSYMRNVNMNISILGDSISTYEGYNPKDYVVYYEGSVNWLI